WDDLIRRHAPDQRTRDAILANPLYQNLMGRFVQSHDYIAMERLYDIHSSGTYDLIVVDTPPTRNALDFLEAPARMADFFSSRFLRWLTVPARSRVLNYALRPFYTIADRRTTFVVVSTLESAPVREAQYFISELRQRNLHLGAVVLNKVLPPYLL